MNFVFIVEHGYILACTDQNKGIISLSLSLFDLIASWWKRSKLCQSHVAPMLMSETTAIGVHLDVTKLCVKLSSNGSYTIFSFFSLNALTKISTLAPCQISDHFKAMCI